MTITKFYCIHVFTHKVLTKNEKKSNKDFYESGEPPVASLVNIDHAMELEMIPHIKFTVIVPELVKTWGPE